MLWYLVNDKEFAPSKLLKLKYRGRHQISQPFCRIGSPQEIMFAVFNLWKFRKSEKSTPESCRELWNLGNDKEFGSLRLLKLKYRRGDKMIQPFCRIGSPQEIRFPMFNFLKFEKPEKSTPEWCRMDWNLLNDEEFGSLKLLFGL